MLKMQMIQLSLRSVVYILLIVNIVVFTGAGYLFFTGREEKKLRISVEALVDRLADELVVVHEELGNAQVELEQSQRLLQAARDDKNMLQVQLADRDKRISEMRFELAQLRTQTGTIDLGELRLTQTNIEPSVKHPAPMEPRIAQSIPRQLGRKGSVIAVNEEFGFVIVSMGANHGIQKGMLLSLDKGGRAAANLRVDMVDETTCAASIVAQTGQAIRIGDAVQASLS